jgi:hypothetical protein
MAWPEEPIIPMALSQNAFFNSNRRNSRVGTTFA